MTGAQIVLHTEPNGRKKPQLAKATQDGPVALSTMPHRVADAPPILPIASTAAKRTLRKSVKNFYVSNCTASIMILCVQKGIAPANMPSPEGLQSRVCF
eukprot:2044898-Pleurochrysis_carterae.AAC.1